MILRDELLPVGRLLKTHGVGGEIVVWLDMDVDLGAKRCVVVDIDGIFVPFFPTGVRQKSQDTDLLKLDGIDTDEAAAALCGKTLFVLRADHAEDEEEEVSEGLYADELVGFQVSSPDGRLKGEIVDVDDSTANVLLVIRTDTGKTVYLPVADEFIVSLDPEKKVMVVAPPEGLLEL